MLYGNGMGIECETKIILINDHLIKVPFYMWYQTKIIATKI